MANLKKIQQSQKDPVDTKEKKPDNLILQMKIEQDKYEEALKGIRKEMDKAVKLPPDAHFRK